MNADKERELTALFNSYDSNGDGVISADELRQAFEKLGQSISEEEIGNMVYTNFQI
jgi:Ca2+-binding EF-hand superfamily protein